MRRSTHVVALVAIFLAGADQPIRSGISTTLIATLVLLPSWWSALRRYTGATLLFAGLGVSLGAGWFLMQLSQADHSIDVAGARGSALLVIGCFATAALVLWSRTFLPTSIVAVTYGIGLLLASVPTVMTASMNWWKFGIAIPTAFIALGLCARSRSRLAPIIVLGLLAGVSLVNDSRSYSGFCVLTAALVLYQHRRSAGQSGWHRLGQVAFLGGLVLSAYFLITSLLVQGYLGEQLESRTRAQIDNSGSLITGGRPEWSATLRLMQDNPRGYGLGVVPNSHDIAVGKTGLYPLNIPTINGYADHYMFGGEFRLHSVAADLWSHFGPAGLALALGVAILLVNSLTRALSIRTATALLVFVTALALWDLAFGPIYSNLRYITLALGLVLHQRKPAGSQLLPDGTWPRA